MKIEIVAEIGVNHDGSLEKAIKLTDAAIAAGADAVKTQLSVAEKETSAFHAREHMEMVRGLILSREDTCKLHDHCVAKGVEFMCTPAEAESLDWLVNKRLIRRIKIASDAVTDLRFLMRAAKKELPVILSTGMADGDEVEDAFMALRRYLMHDDITLLHCTSLYPCSPGDVNLRAMQALMPLGVRVGWSDHTLSLTLALAAAALGAVLIEKHVTLDRRVDGPDHAASLEPHQFAMMVGHIRELEQAMGDGIKRPRPGELETAKVVRKSVCAGKPIRKGERLSWDNTAVLRPGTGISPARLKLVWGTTARRDYAEGEMIDAEVEMIDA